MNQKRLGIGLRCLVSYSSPGDSDVSLRASDVAQRILVL